MNLFRLKNGNSTNHNRWAAMLLAAVVAILTCVTVANATQTITTPNAANISYNLNAGANSAAITLASNRSVLVMGCTTNLNPGVGHVSLLHVPAAGAIPGVIEWVGLESPSGGGSSITAAASSLPIHIVYIDFNHTVDIQVASADTILIHNGSTGTRAGNVTLIW
jgi:hypothetical protein